MTYTEVSIVLKPVDTTASEILQALMGDIDYESFVDDASGFKAYLPQTKYQEEALKTVIEQLPLPVDVSYTLKEIPAENWNETWEKNYFQPIVIGDQCLIKSSFHKTEAKCKYEILIDPKMSFGTGHHSTTWLVAERMTRMEFQNKSVLDMGCGTGILAILAGLKGASPIVAIDIDEWAYKNGIENIQLNKQSQIDIRLGGAEQIGNLHFDIILANINRNILLKDMAHYGKALKTGGTILFSGFYTQDLDLIKASALENRMTFVQSSSKLNWVVAEFKKQ